MGSKLSTALVQVLNHGIQAWNSRKGISTGGKTLCGKKIENTMELKQIKKQKDADDG